MKTLLPLLSLLFFAACSCPPGDPCQDPALVTVPEEDDSAPVGQWSFSQAYSQPDGSMSSSISLVEDPSLPVELTLDPAARTSVQFESRDDQSGIRCLRLSGGFGFTCVQPRGTSLNGHGMLAEKVICPGLSICGMRSLNLEQDYLEQYLSSCSPPFALSSGEFTLSAVSENMTGVKDTQRLTVIFRPMTF
jgi:hypothetical protein